MDYIKPTIIKVPEVEVFGDRLNFVTLSYWPGERVKVTIFLDVERINSPKEINDILPNNLKVRVENKIYRIEKGKLTPVKISDGGKWERKYKGEGYLIKYNGKLNYHEVVFATVDLIVEESHE